MLPIPQRSHAISSVSDAINQIDVSLSELKSKKEKMDRRLSFLLEEENLEMAHTFKEEYKRQYLQVQGKEQELHRQKNHFRSLQQRLLDVVHHSTTGELSESANKALTYAQKKDMVSLRSSYRGLFQKVVVRVLGECKVQLRFIFKGDAASRFLFEAADENCTQERLATSTFLFENIFLAIY